MSRVESSCALEMGVELAQFVIVTAPQTQNMYIVYFAKGYRKQYKILQILPSVLVPKQCN
jgi:hypothetical protein